MMYKEDDNSLIAYSTSEIDNVEQIISTSSFSNGIIKIKAITDDFSHGMNSESFAVAGFNNIQAQEVSMPGIGLEMKLPSNGHMIFKIKALIRNDGDVPLHNVDAVLNLPAGLNVIGNNLVSIGKLNSGDTRQIVWDVEADAEGSYDNIYVSVASDSYGEILQEDSLVGSVTVEKTKSNDNKGDRKIFAVE